MTWSMLNQIFCVQNLLKLNCKDKKTPIGIVNTITCRSIPGISCYP